MTLRFGRRHHRPETQSMLQQDLWGSDYTWFMFFMLKQFHMKSLHGGFFSRMTAAKRGAQMAVDSRQGLKIANESNPWNFLNCYEMMWNDVLFVFFLRSFFWARIHFWFRSQDPCGEIWGSLKVNPGLILASWTNMAMQKIMEHPSISIIYSIYRSLSHIFPVFLTSTLASWIQLAMLKPC